MNINEYEDASAIWLEYKDGLIGYLFNRVKDKELAEELSRQSLMKLYYSCCSGKEIKNVRSWLFRIAHNVMIDHFKLINKAQRSLPTDRLIEDFEEDDIYKQAAPWIEPLIKLLPEEYGLPLKMADIEKQKQQDIAEQLGLGLPATKSRIQRARKLLREKIQECCSIELNDKGQLQDFAIKKDCEPLTGV